MQKLINEVWTDCVEGDLSVGDDYRISVGGDGWQQQKYNPESKEDTERGWRDSELAETDGLLQIDRPDYQAILSYRVALRDYPSQPSFPNGTRPSL